MNNLDNYTRVCKDTVGYTKRVYLAKFVDYDETQILLTDGVITTIPSMIIYKYDVEGSYSQKSNLQGGAISWDQNIDINLNKVYNTINPSVFTNQKFRVIVETNNGDYLMFGLFNGLNCSLDNGSGDSKSAFNGFSLTFNGIEEDAANLTDIDDYTIYTPPVPSIYGYLYNWYAANDANFAPTDWRLPTVVEMNTLSTYLGGDTVSGGKLKESGLAHWETPNTGDHDSGFLGFGGGFRSDSDGAFSGLKGFGYFWGADLGSGYASRIELIYNTESIDIDYNLYPYGFSVRLLYTGTGTPTSMTDYDGNTYDVVKIGTQYWTAQNWKCTHLNEGTALTKVTDNTAWSVLTTEGFCAYKNDEDNV